MVILRTANAPSTEPAPDDIFALRAARMVLARCDHVCDPDATTTTMKLAGFPALFPVVFPHPDLFP
jgi:hypothetical protein